MKPRILVTAAAGHTGSVVANELLRMGFPVRAFVRQADTRAARLQNAGAEIFVGNLSDPRDLERALFDVQRAYHCQPFGPNLLHNSMLFAVAAEAARLEVVAHLTAWNPHPTHPSIHQREHWLTNNLLRWMPSVGVVTLNPGLFAFTYFFGLPAVAHFGTLMLPFGDGRNAPPSNEDIAAVAAAALAAPERHIGKTYRPTGPKLVSGHDVADILGRILQRRVRYRDVSTAMFLKAAGALGFSRFERAQIRHYAEELRGGAYAVGAPTNHVEQVCGRPAEAFDETARRYIRNPALIFPQFKIGSRLGACGLMIRTLLTRVPDLDRWESERDYPLLAKAQLAHTSEAWRNAAARRATNARPGNAGDSGPVAATEERAA